MRSLLSRIGDRGLVILISLMLALVIFIHPFTRELGELWLYDVRLLLLRNPEPTGEIVFISIDQSSLDKYGAFPWKRSMYARMLDLLKESRPSLAVFDVLFQEPRPEDADFARAIRDAGFPVVLANNFSTVNAINDQRIVPVVGDLAGAAKGEGFIDLTRMDPDGKIRWASLALELEGKTYLSLDMVVYAVLKGLDGDAIRPGKGEILAGARKIPTDDGWAIPISYFFGKETEGTLTTFPVLSFHKVMEREEVRKGLRGKILIVGAGTPGMQDDFATPLGERTYGALIHAAIIDTLLGERFLRRAPGWLDGIILVMIVLVYGLVLFRIGKAQGLALASAGFIGGFTLLNGFLFKAGFWVSLAAPMFTAFACTLSMLGVKFFRTHRLFQQFVSPEVVDKMVSSDEYARLGGVEKEVTIVFTDIRGYTSLSERLTPSQVMEMLNEYHTEMVHLFEKNNGRVINYMGDAQLVVFGAPVEVPDHALWACRAALETQKALSVLVEKWNVENREAIEVGVGICSGTVAIGMVGAEGHKQYTIIGDATNVSSRLQGQSKVLGAPIIISPSTAELVKDHYVLRPLGKVELKGKSEAMEVFTIAGEKGSGQ
jgi:adenylate cyclase